MYSLERRVSFLVDRAYSQTIADDPELSIEHDMSRSRECQTLTYNFFKALEAAHMSARREFHGTPLGYWHYLVAHVDEEEPPTHDDMITDLNPWQFARANLEYTGPLHGPRRLVQESLRTAGAPSEVVALRGVETIVFPHTVKQLRPAQGL